MLEKILALFQKPKLPSDVTDDLQKVVSVLRSTPAPILEVRLFGSLHKGGWNSNTSDIDIAVFMAHDQHYSCYNRTVAYSIPCWDGDRAITRETPERASLRTIVRSHPDLKYGSRYQLHLATIDDLQQLELEDAPFVKSMRKGRLLY